MKRTNATKTDWVCLTLWTVCGIGYGIGGNTPAAIGNIVILVMFHLALMQTYVIEQKDEAIKILIRSMS